MVTVDLFITLSCHPLTRLSIVFSFVPRCVSSSVVSVSVESVVSSSAHPGGARAPPGCRDRQRPARPGPTQTPRHHDNDNNDHAWTLLQHVDDTAATVHAQSASGDAPEC